MSKSRARWTALGLVAVLAIGLSVLWLRWSARPEFDEAAESAGREHAAEFAAGSVLPPANVEVVEGGEPAAQATRVELPRDPSTIGPRKTHAKVELVCWLTGTETKSDEVRIQVFADSEAQEIDGNAVPAVFAQRSQSQSWVADVTPLFIGVARLPGKLRVVAQDSRCKGFVDVVPNLSAEELAGPSSFTLGASVRFDCPWFVRGRIVAPCPPAEVRVSVGATNDLFRGYQTPLRVWKPDEEGRFALPMESTGRMMLVFRAAAALSIVREFEIDGSRDVELGEIVLERGVSISGQLLAAGQPLAGAQVALVRAGEAVSSDTLLELFASDGVGTLQEEPALRRVIADLGLFKAHGGSAASITIEITNQNGSFASRSLRAGDYWLVVLSAGGQSTWLAPMSFTAPGQDFVHDFDATSVRFDLLDAQGSRARKDRPFSLHVRMPDGERIELESSWVRFGELRALVKPGSLLELHACGQEVLVSVGHSTEPIVRSVSPCTEDSETGK